MLGSLYWDVLQALGESLTNVGIVVVSEQSTVAQRVRGLRMGADDWIGKPCHPEEVVARVESVTRRHRRAEVDAVSENGPIVFGELEFRVDRYEVLASGRPVDLTKREYELLLLLARSDGRVLPREDIYQRVWGYAMARGDRSVDVFVRKVRHKLEATSPDWRYVHTHFGIGYRFDPEPVDADALVDPVAATPETAAAELTPDSALVS
jgi:DNA-binding response OmpR family regulator